MPSWRSARRPSSQIRQVASCIAKGQAVFFVGAGMSRMAGHPTWDELIHPLRHRLKLKPGDDASPALVAQFYMNQFGANDLYSYVRRSLAGKHLRPTEAHQLLCSLPTSVLVTTNYDDLLESALRWNGTRFHVIRDEAEMALWNEDEEVQILKLHGDLSSAHSIVLTDWDYVRFLAEKSLFKRKLGELFCFRDVIFVGYSLRDPNVSLIFNAICHELGGLKRPSYIVTFDDDRHRLAEWERRGMQAVCLAPASEDEPADMGQLLSSFLRDLVTEVNATNRSVLVVDDDDKILAAYKRLLELAIEGVNVHTASDGLAASLLFGQVRPRLVIVDLEMPKLNGWEFIELVRQFAGPSETRIIVFTGSPQAWQPERGKKLEVDHFFVKPGVTAELQRIAKHLLGIREGYSDFPPSLRPGETRWRPAPTPKAPRVEEEEPPSGTDGG